MSDQCHVQNYTDLMQCHHNHRFMGAVYAIQTLEHQITLVDCINKLAPMVQKSKQDHQQTAAAGRGGGGRGRGKGRGRGPAKGKGTVAKHGIKVEARKYSPKEWGQLSREERDHVIQLRQSQQITRRLAALEGTTEDGEGDGEAAPAAQGSSGANAAQAGAHMMRRS